MITLLNSQLIGPNHSVLGSSEHENNGYETRGNLKQGSQFHVEESWLPVALFFLFLSNHVLAVYKVYYLFFLKKT